MIDYIVKKTASPLESSLISFPIRARKSCVGGAAEEGLEPEGSLPEVWVLELRVSELRDWELRGLQLRIEGWAEKEKILCGEGRAGGRHSHKSALHSIYLVN